MKTKRLFLCLMLLLVSASSAWADKYYQPGSYKGETTPRLTLEQAVGKKFMIYNTAINGAEDRTGFLRNNGVQFEHDKSKERDLYVYNETFVYTMEAYDDNADGVNDWYAIKSVNTGLYVNFNGRTDVLKATDAKLLITDWDNATGKSGVNMESWKYEVIANNQITDKGHGSTVFVVKNYNGGDRPYWNGTVGGFDTWSDAHPYAFYEAHEVTSGDYLQDLHIYSRCDIYSAQVIYGYVQTADQITANPSFTDEGGFANLIDGDAATYNVTNWNNSVAGHYYQIDLGRSVESLYLYMQRRADGMNAPVKYELQACATADGNYTKIGEYTTELASSSFYTSDAIDLNGSYRYIRIVARETTTSGYTCMGLSELSVLPTTKEVSDAIGYINASQTSKLFKKTTANAYATLVEGYNTLYPEARLLSGVPLPGHKYRIYADAYDIDAGVYVNKEIKAGDGLNIMPAGSYYTEEANKAQYEWYCEQTADGYLVFRNVADPAKYLADGRVVTEPYKWSINTVHTTHYGVPLMNAAMQYLAVANDGYWQGDVKTAQDQTQPYAYTAVDDKGTDDASDDVTETNTIACGVCTDFVFIPVPLDETEKTITITAGELVERNTQLLYDSDNNGTPEVYPLPFSRMFKKTGDSWGNLPTLQLLCSDIHSYAGVKINNGETLVTVATTPKVDYNEATSTLSFNFDEIESGDVLDVQLTIKAPFKYSDPDMAKGVKPTLYIIKNMRSQGVQQQARPNRADVNIEIGGDENDQPISSQTGKYYYAKFEMRNSNMSLVQNDVALDAHSLFYFTKTEDTDTDEYYSTNIHNVTTVMKCASDISWNANGNTWYVQPNKTYSFTGYNIAATILNATNNPGDTWCSNHSDGDRIVRYNANDDGSAWIFEEVEDARAKELLIKYINNVADSLTAELGSINAKQAAAMGYDTLKIKNYKSIVSQLDSLAQVYYNETNIAKLVQYAQNIHMIEHEIDYALYALPELSDEAKMDETANFTDPHWYYIRNVKDDNFYVAHQGDDVPMYIGALTDSKKSLSNMFYFVGEKNSYGTNGYVDFPGNNLIIDDYLRVHIHNFAAKKKTLVSKNVELTNQSNVKPSVQNGKQILATGLGLKGDESWQIVLEYDLAHDYQAYNSYGSCLLASSGDPLADTYTNEFQIYLKDDRSVVVKMNCGDDRYRFWHTQDNFSHIKIVITYSQQSMTFDIYNSLGEKETLKLNQVHMNPVDKLSTALPANGANVENLATYQVEEMTWKTHEEVQNAENKDDWYILPSSNLENIGMAIVLDDPNDAKMGWSYMNNDETITPDLGTRDNSTWKFERVTDFDAHMDELLEMYNFEDCVIYDRELAALMGLIEKNKALIEAQENGEGEEALFNEVYYASLNYTGCMPEELKAPKPGNLYTIRPVDDKETDNSLLVFVDKSDANNSTKEVYNADAIRDDQSYDTRAVWKFEGTANGDYLALTNLKAKNIHTQCYLTALGDDKSAVNETDEASIALSPLGGCTTMFQVGGDKYMAMNGAKVVNTGNENTKWIVEVIKNPEESVYFETSTNTNGHSTLMLGFPTLIPDEVEAFHGVSDGDILDGRYISMVSYGEPGETRILPANAPVILRNTDQSIESKSVKFYYRDSNDTAVEDNYIIGYLYFTLVDCSSFDDIDGDGIADRDVDIYMLNKNGTTTRMYRTYENYNSEGVKESINGTTSHFESGHVTCKANKSFMVLSKDTSASVSSLAFTFRPGTTSIDDVETDSGEVEIIETIYDLQGRKLSEITQPGIYIVNGKKVFVK